MNSSACLWAGIISKLRQVMGIEFHGMMLFVKDENQQLARICPQQQVVKGLKLINKWVSAKDSRTSDSLRAVSIKKPITYAKIILFRNPSSCLNDDSVLFIEVIFIMWIFQSKKCI